jgi:hypothetical protein
LYDHEVFCRSAVRAVRRPPGSSPTLRLPLRVRANAPSLVMPDQFAPPGVSRPFSDVGGGIVRPGFASPGAVRPRGFSPPRRVDLPPTSRTREVRSRAGGFRLENANRRAFSRLAASTDPPGEAATPGREADVNDAAPPGKFGLRLAHRGSLAHQQTSAASSRY